MRLAPLFIIVLLTIPIVQYAQAQVSVPDYVVPGKYFYYNGTISQGGLRVCGIYSFEYNYTIISFNATTGELVMTRERIIKEDGRIVKREFHKITTGLYHTKTGQFFVLPEYIFDKRVLEAMISGLAIDCVNLTFTYYKTNYTLPIGNFSAYFLNITALQYCEAGNETWIHGVVGHMVIAENGLLLETTLRFVNITKGISVTQFEEYGGLSLRLASTNYITKKETEETITKAEMPESFLIIVISIIIIAIIVAAIIIRKRRVGKVAQF